MIQAKTQKEIEIMTEGGRRLGRIRDKLKKAVKVGVSPKDIDLLAEKLIIEAGGEPSFKKVKGYHWTTCININDGVVHGIPTPTPFKEEDLVSVDVGMFFQGYHTDTSFTVPVSKPTREITRFLEAGELALKRATQEAKVGNRISHISLAFQKTLQEYGFEPVRALTGHGIGKKLHESPQIPIFWEGSLESGEIIPEGAVFALEAIYTLGSPDLVLLEDNWTIATKDGKIAGLFEETVAVTKQGPKVLTA